MADSVRIFEVGPRDGLQNERQVISLKHKLEWIKALVKAGIHDIEVGAFVRHDRVPQMADTDFLCEALTAQRKSFGAFQSWCLVPNRHGLRRAFRAGVTRMAVFGAATETFAQKNIGMSIGESFQEFQSVIREAREVLGTRFQVRGYISTVFGCPFEGKVSASKALRIIEKMAEIGVDQISIGDTIGVATPLGVQTVIQPALKLLGPEKTAVHFHDTRGTALANTLRSLDLGVRIVDSSAGGLGGCPFAPGAAGNLATEDLVYMLNGMKIRSGVQLDLLCEASLKLSTVMKRPLTSRYLQTYSGQRRPVLKRQKG